MSATTDFDGDIALVTGGGKGVGRVTARKLAERGAHVIVNYFHSPEDATRTEAEIRAAGGSVELLRGSVAKRDTAERLFAEVAERHGRLDVLVNNAAHGVMRPLGEITERDWERVLNTGLHGTRWCTEFAAPLLAVRPGGAVVTMSSVGGSLVIPNYTATGVAKAAIETLTRYLAVEYGPLGIRVNAASASVIDGPVLAAWPEAAVFKAAVEESSPLGHRLVTEDELAEAVLFLASRAASGITGQVISVDRGVSTGYSISTGYWSHADRPQPHDTPAELPDDGSAEDDSDDDGLVAVVGMGIAVPGAASPEEFWRVLHGREAAFSEPDIAIDHFWSADPAAEDRMYVRRSGHLRDFRPDAALAEGDTLPSGARWLRHALRQAMRGVTTRSDDRVTFIPAIGIDGCQHSEETAVVEQLAAGAGEHADAVRAALGRHLPYAVADPDRTLPYRQARAATAGVLPEGTTVLIADAACASSLYTVDLGAKSIADGRADIAVCGGISMLTPRFNVEFAKLAGLSPSEDVRCFDRDADGVILSDGAALVALKSLRRARADGDTVLGVLAGFGAAADGRGKAVYAPNQTGQERAIRRARAVRGVSAAEVDWIVAHATGTPTGDRTELGTLASVTADASAVVTSNKSLIGHTTAAAGVVSLLHALLGLRHGEIPAQQRFTSLPEDVSRQAAAITVPTVDTPLPAGRGRTVGVSAFGFGGADAHQLLVDDRTGLAGRSIPDLIDDPLVVVGWGTHLPGEPGPDEIRRWLRGEADGYPFPPDFGDRYPEPPFRQVRMPQQAIRTTDRTQLMAIAAVAHLIDQIGEPWSETRELTGVVAAHAGFARVSGAAALRAYRHWLDHVLDKIRVESGDAVADTIAERLAAGCEATPAISEDTAPGTLQNVIAGRVANRYDLNGLAIAVDVGEDSFLGALRVAGDYLRTGELDMCLVVGVAGNATSWLSRIAAVPGPLAEGAFAIALTRRSVARTRRLDIRARLRPGDTALPPLPRPAGPAYFGTDSAVALLRAIEDGAGSGTLTPSNGDASLAVTVEPVTDEPPRPVAGTTATTERFRVLLRAEPGWRVGDREPEPAVPDGSLVLTDDAEYARRLAGTVDKAGGCLVCTDPACPPEIGTVVADVTEKSLRQVVSEPVQHLRVISNGARAQGWPQLPPAETTRLGELVFLAMRDHTALLTTVASVGVLVVDGFLDASPTPYASLITAPLKSFLWDQPQRPYVSVVTDAGDLADGLAQFGYETAHRTPFWRLDMPTAYYRAGVRHFYRLAPDPVTGDRAALADGSVVVASGGARGITAASLTGLAHQVKATFWLLGSTDIDRVPPEILALPDHEFAAYKATFITESRKQDPARSVAEISRQYEWFERAREVWKSIDELAAAAGADRVHYLACDVTDPDAVARAAEQVLATAGRVDLLVHGAGIQRAAELERKSLADFRAVRDVKIDGYHHLKAAFGSKVVRWCNFGSLTGLIGLPGEADYTIANDYVAAAAFVERDVMARNEHTIAWIVWRETGLAADSRSNFLFAKKLTNGVSTREGQRFFTAHLSDDSAPYVVQLDPLCRRSATELVPSLFDSVLGRSTGPGGEAGRFFLDRLLERTDDRAVWEHRYHEDTETYLQQHHIFGHVTVPGSFLVEISAEAAAALVPGTVPRAVRDVDFQSFLRHYPGRPMVFRVVAERLGREGPYEAVLARVVSDTVAPDGRVLSHDRQHAEMTVLLGPATERPAPQYWQPWPELPERRLRLDHGVVGPNARLTGIFAGNREGRLHPYGGRVTFDPAVLTVDPTLPKLLIPCVLLDAMFRLPRVDPDNADNVIATIPVGLSRLSFDLTGNDLALTAPHARGIELYHDAAEDRVTAVDPDGRVLMRLSALRYIKANES